MPRLLALGCAAAYLVLAGLVVLRSRRDLVGLALAAASLVTVTWALFEASLSAGPNGNAPLGLMLADPLDPLRLLAWYGFGLALHRRLAPTTEGPFRIFVVLGAGLLAGTVGIVILERPGIVSLGSTLIDMRLATGLATILLVENLWRNADEDQRWHVNLPCIALGGLAVFDVLLFADAVLTRHFSETLLAGRLIATLIVAPLLAIGAARNRRWGIDIHVSRRAVFHSATLIASGVFLLALGAVGETFRRFGAQWRQVGELSLLFGGIVTILVLVTSASARSRLTTLFVDNFFSHRFDYRQQWLRSITTLSGETSIVGTTADSRLGDDAPGPAAARGDRDGSPAGRRTPIEPAPLGTRAIRAVADIVDSPAGLLFLRAGTGASLDWSGAWNLPPAAIVIVAGDPLLARLESASAAVVLSAQDLAGPLAAVPRRPWLAVPLLQWGKLFGVIVLTQPRAAFELDQEVFDLLRMVARAVAAFLAEQQATRELLEARQLRDYGKRFAFVAHDIKNVAGQLSLLLSNARDHLDNPDFQQDMLATVGASVQKIRGLLARLQPGNSDASDAPAPGAPLPVVAPGDDARRDPEPGAERSVELGADRRSTADLSGLAGPAGLAIAPRLRRIALGGARGLPVRLEGLRDEMSAAMPAVAFDAAIGHLLDNAADATRAAGRGPTPIRLRVAEEGDRPVIEVIDSGIGMTPEFIRDALFRPFATSKPDGSGIGAYQARELLREAGGDLLVRSEPGVGTTMRLLLPLVGQVPPATRRRA